MHLTFSCVDAPSRKRGRKRKLGGSALEAHTASRTAATIPDNVSDGDDEDDGDDDGEEDRGDHYSEMVVQQPDYYGSTSSSASENDSDRPNSRRVTNPRITTYTDPDSMSQFVSSRYTSALALELLRLHAENQTLRVQLARSKEETTLARAALNMQEVDLRFFKDMFLNSPFSTVVVDPPTARIVAFNLTFLNHYGLEEREVTDSGATYGQFVADPAALAKYQRMIPLRLDPNESVTLKKLWEKPIPVTTRRKDGSLMQRHIMGYIMNRFIIFVCCEDDGRPCSNPASSSSSAAH